MYESESETHSVMSSSLLSQGLYSPWHSPGQNTGMGNFPSPGDLPNPGIKPRSPALQVDSLPAEPQEKPKNIGVGSLSLLQQIFPTQEKNWGLPPCRRILYQLSYRTDILNMFNDLIGLVNSLAVQWLRFYAFTAEGPGSIPD